MTKHAVILAGGLGTRLRPFSEVIPKPLLPLGEKAITEVQIHQLRDQGFTDITLATNYMSDYVEAYLGDGGRHGVRLHYSREKERLGTCGPLSLLRDRLTSPFVVMNGDILTKLDFGAMYETAIADEPDLTVCTKMIATPFRFGSVTVEGSNRLVGVVEKPEFSVEIVAGIYCMKPEIFSMIPDNTYFGMDNLILSMIQTGKPVGRYLMSEYWLDVGQVEDYSKAREEYQSHFIER